MLLVPYKQATWCLSLKSLARGETIVLKMLISLLARLSFYRPLAPSRNPSGQAPKKSGQAPKCFRGKLFLDFLDETPDCMDKHYLALSSDLWQKALGHSPLPHNRQPLKTGPQSLYLTSFRGMGWVERAIREIWVGRSSNDFIYICYWWLKHLNFR